MRSRPGRTSSQSPAPAGSSSQRCWPRWRSSSVTRPAGQKRTAAPTKRRSRVHAWEACHGENKTQDQGNRSKIKENQKENRRQIRGAHKGTKAAALCLQSSSRARFRSGPAPLFRLSRSRNRTGDERHGAGACDPDDQTFHSGGSGDPALPRRRLPDGLRAEGVVPKRIRRPGRAHVSRRLMLDSAAQDQAHRARLFRRLRASRNRVAGGFRDRDAQVVKWSWQETVLKGGASRVRAAPKSWGSILRPSRATMSSVRSVKRGSSTTWFYSAIRDCTP